MADIPSFIITRDPAGQYSLQIDGKVIQTWMLDSIDKPCLCTWLAVPHGPLELLPAILLKLPSCSGLEHTTICLPPQTGWFCIALCPLPTTIMYPTLETALYNLFLSYLFCDISIPPVLNNTQTNFHPASITIPWNKTQIDFHQNITYKLTSLCFIQFLTDYSYLFPKFTYLNVDNQNFTNMLDSELEPINSLTCLEVLSLHASSLKLTTSPSFFSKLTKLQTLDLGDNSILSIDANAFPNPSALTSLYLQNLGLTSFEATDSLSGLTYLRLGENPSLLNDEQWNISGLSSLTSLRLLQIEGRDIKTSIALDNLVTLLPQISSSSLSVYLNTTQTVVSKKARACLLKHNILLILVTPCSSISKQ